MYDVMDHVGDIIGAPRGLQIEDRSFRKFADRLAARLDFTVEPELPHCLRLV